MTHSFGTTAPTQALSTSIPFTACSSATSIGQCQHCRLRASSPFGCFALHHRLRPSNHTHFRNSDAATSSVASASARHSCQALPLHKLTPAMHSLRPVHVLYCKCMLWLVPSHHAVRPFTSEQTCSRCTGGRRLLNCPCSCRRHKRAYLIAKRVLQLAPADVVDCLSSSICHMAAVSDDADSIIFADTLVTRCAAVGRRQQFGPLTGAAKSCERACFGDVKGATIVRWRRRALTVCRPHHMWSCFAAARLCSVMVAQHSGRYPNRLYNNHGGKLVNETASHGMKVASASHGHTCPAM